MDPRAFINLRYTKAVSALPKICFWFHSYKNSYLFPWIAKIIYGNFWHFLKLSIWKRIFRKCSSATIIGSAKPRPNSQNILRLCMQLRLKLNFKFLTFSENFQKLLKRNYCWFRLPQFVFGSISSKIPASFDNHQKQIWSLLQISIWKRIFSTSCFATINSQCFLIQLVEIYLYFAKKSDIRCSSFLKKLQFNCRKIKPIFLKLDCHLNDNTKRQISYNASPKLWKV